MVEAGAQPPYLLLSNNPESDGFRFLIKRYGEPVWLVRT